VPKGMENNGVDNFSVQGGAYTKPLILMKLATPPLVTIGIFKKLTMHVVGNK
jgi:hypothetical protein